MVAVLKHRLRREEDDAHASALLEELEARLLSTAVLGNSTCGSRTRCSGTPCSPPSRRDSADPQLARSATGARDLC